MLARFVEENQVLVIPFTEGHYGMALTAWLKYGKGRHQAALNLGDCLTYAVAKAADMPLLCVGDDLPQTDLNLA
jgi:ribonuclease VapC